MCVLVCVAPPMVVGAWLMVGALRQLFEYYEQTICHSEINYFFWAGEFNNRFNV